MADLFRCVYPGGLLIAYVAKIENVEIDLGKKHKLKSKTLIAKIQENLNNYFSDRSISVFSLGLPNEFFNRSEYLFDVQVCRIDILNSNVHKEIKYIS